MSELHDDIVADFQLRQDLVQTELGQERRTRQPTLGIVGYGHLRSEPTCNHLSPRRPGLILLVYDGRVAAEEDGGDVVGRLYPDTLHGWSRTAESKAQRVVPVLVGDLTGLQPNPHITVDDGTVLIHDKRYSLKLPLLRRHQVHIMPSRLRPNHGLCRFLLRTEGHSHPVVAVRHSHRETEGSRTAPLEQRIDNDL